MEEGIYGICGKSTRLGDGIGIQERNLVGQGDAVVAEENCHKWFGRNLKSVGIQKKKKKKKTLGEKGGERGKKGN